MSIKLEQLSSMLEKEVNKTPFGKKPESLYAPARYIMSLGGKRLRPMLTLMSYSLFKQDPNSIVKYAVAVEAFHNFTLMHDDIMDAAPLRRGKPTVHKVWNQSTAILSGDVMLVRVYEMFSDLPDTHLRRVLKAFNKCATEVCEGQQWDMEFESRDTVTEAQYITMIKLKTAVLLGFSLELGGILADASEEQCTALREFGVNIGIGFQLKDDLLDAYADPKKFGKQVGGDIIANKKTFLLINAINKASGKEKRELTKWLTATRFKKQEKVTAVKNIFDVLSIPRLTERKVATYFKKGFAKLEALPAGEARSSLELFTQNLIDRQS